MKKTRKKDITKKFLEDPFKNSQENYTKKLSGREKNLLVSEELASVRFNVIIFYLLILLGISTIGNVFLKTFKGILIGELMNKFPDELVKKLLDKFLKKFI